MRSFAPKLNPSQRPAPVDPAPPSVAIPGLRERAAPRFERSPGNQAAQPEHTARSFPTASTHLSYDFSRIPVHPPAAQTEQQAATISEPSNQYEQQADRLANQVMYGGRSIDLPNRRVSSAAKDPLAASADYSSGGESALESEDRRFFESRPTIILRM
jgi:hypothetical protein